MIYVHVPFCRSFCTYCDFYSEIACRGKDAAAIEKYLGCLLEEIKTRRQEIETTKAVNTLYIGGGTPSVLPLCVLERIVSALGQDRYDEFTIEVNPEDIVEKGEAYVKGLLSMGVSRISMGVQSLSDPILRWMNRRHSSDGAREAMKILRSCGCENVSVDIIFGLSNLSDDTLLQTLREILEWSPEHISAYQLSIEEGSALCEMMEKGQYREADEEQCRRQYELICTELKGAGYEHYEISNWARRGFVAKHNSAYWTRAPYVGLGPGAHSLKGKDVRCWNSKELSGWKQECEHLSPEEVREERIMLGLRTAAGVDGMKIEEKDFFIADSIIAEHL